MVYSLNRAPSPRSGCLGGERRNSDPSLALMFAAEAKSSATQLILSVPAACWGSLSGPDRALPGGGRSTGSLGAGLAPLAQRPLCPPGGSRPPPRPGGV